MDNSFEAPDAPVDPALLLDAVLAAVRALRAVSFESIPEGRALQATIGWLRSLLDQVEIIHQSMELGLSRATSPNRRQLAELILRLSWVAHHGDDAVNALVEKEQEEARKHQNHLETMGVLEPPDFSDLAELETDAPPALRSSAGGITNLAREMQSAGMYRAWWFETQYSHATAYLAVTLAPLSDGAYETGEIAQANEPEKLLRDMLFYGMYYATLSILRRDVEDPGLIDAWFDSVGPILSPADQREQT